MNGDLTCGSSEVVNERLVFEQDASGKKRVYLIKTIGLAKTGGADTESLNEFKRLVGDDYQIKSLFYSDGGLRIIFEK